ncbi:transcriptional regulator Cro/CI family [Corallococcus sp. CAG:1435]|nr:transcriptional regulator Cro/CI family [Corallococcus sp. CAG:1435]
MTVCQAVAKRVNRLLTERKMSQYRLEQNSGIQHGTMNSIMSARNKGVELNTVMMIAKGFNMTVIEFLDDPVFTSDDLEVE